MRLDKFLTQAGIGTRSQVKEHIRKGRILVNGFPEKTADCKVDEDRDEITFQGKRVFFQKMAYYMLNKPAGCVSATRDNKETTVLELLAAENRKDLFPVGRLDKDTEGLLLITNDGALAHRLLAPGRHVPKKYVATLAADLSEEQIERLERGLDIGEKRPTLPAVFEWKDRERKEACLTITEGKFHQVKRMFEAVGNQVLFLKRVGMGSLTLDETLPPGAYRLLTETELAEICKYKEE